MTSEVIRPISIPQPRSWDRAVALTLVGLAITLGLGLGIQNAESSSSPDVDAKVTSFEPSSQARRLRALTEDRVERQVEIHWNPPPIDGSIRHR